jgi:hypothetical protein
MPSLRPTMTPLVVAFALTLITWVFFYWALPDGPLNQGSTLVVFVGWYAITLMCSRFSRSRMTRRPPSMRGFFGLVTMSAVIASSPVRAASVAGTVSREWLGIPARVVLIDRRTKQEYRTDSDSSGQFRLADVPDGLYYLLALGPLDAPPVLRELSIPSDSSIDVEFEPRFQPAIRPDNSLCGKGDPPLVCSPPPPLPRLTGRAFLPHGEHEAAGYGLYSYVLFGTSPTDGSRVRYEAGIKGFIQLVSEISAFSLPHARLNVTYLTVQRRQFSISFPIERGEPSGPAASIVADYDYPRAAELLSSLGRGLMTGGPYIVSVARPLSASAAQPPSVLLLQDLSGVPISLIVPWIKEFLVQASRADFSKESSVQTFVLKLRTDIEVIALALPDVKGAFADWKAALSSLIVPK